MPKTGRKRLNHIYQNMKYRCNNSNYHHYKNYGGRGIKVCDEWLNRFEAFYKWSIENGYEDNLTIDRINNDGNYEPSNCQWITREENTAKSNRETRRRFSDKGTYYGISPNGKRFVFDNASKFGREHDLNHKCIRKCANGNLKTYKGWKFGFI